MNKMNLPGFTAEASLYKTNKQYNMNMAEACNQVNGAIYPARLSPIFWLYEWGRLADSQYLKTRECCQNCAVNCKEKCFDKSCVDDCIDEICSSKCNAYDYEITDDRGQLIKSGCKALLGL
jgi:hypothetical protein